MQMDAHTKRKHLEAYTWAARNIELTGAAIVILEGVDGNEARTAIRVLMRSQQRHLKRLDAAAAKLGAPYGA